MANRDDFSPKIKEILKARVNNRCSNPDCRVPTTGPTEHIEKVNNIGIAAHISAASIGGPRYDPSMSKDERTSIRNAIWLCSNCSIKIDRDPDKYNVQTLKNWKNTAEQKASEELGKKLPDDNYVVQSLATAITGQTSIFLPNLISNASKAISLSLEKLDPRFSVKTHYIDELTRFEVRAKEPVDAKIIVKKDFSDEYKERFLNFYNHGDDLNIDSQAIEVKGSPLIEEIFSQKGRLEFKKKFKKKTIQKIWVINPINNEKIQFNDIIVDAVTGSSSMTLIGSTYDNIVKIKYRIYFNEFEKIDKNFTFTIDFREWDNKEIPFLPYFNSIYDLFSKINNGWEFHSSLEIEGEKIFAGVVNNFRESKYFKYIYSQLNYIFILSKICQKLNLSFVYDHSYMYSADEHMRVIEIYKILYDGISLDKSSINDNAKCTLEVADDLSNINAIIEAKGKPTSLRFEQLEQETITPFSQSLILPKFIHTFSEVVPIIKTDISNLKPGDLVEIEWEPTEDCKYTVEAELPNNSLAADARTSRG